MLSGGGEVFKYPNCDDPHYEKLVEAQSKGMESLWVRAVGQVEKQKGTREAKEDVQHVFLSVVKGQKKDEG
jgi:hypothetical protein